MKLNSLFRQSSNSPKANLDSHWIPLADLMTGLMMVFLFIAIIFMIKVEQNSKNIQKMAINYDKTKVQLYNQLNEEFSKNLKDWGAEIDKDLTIRFTEPEVLFDAGNDNIKPKFMNILVDFFPRYIQILSSSNYKSIVEEIRIEGHTSSFWSKNVAIENAYFLNMELSQKRTRSVLQYVMSLNLNDKNWIKSHLTANGLSSSKLIFNKDKTENILASQRVEFRLRTNSEKLVDSILNDTNIKR